MKWFSGVVIFLVFGATNTMAIEEAEYKTVLSDQDFEVRRYESHILAETIVGGDFEDAGSEAFGQLFKYISGNNTSQQKVKMTAPVAQSLANEKIDMTAPVGQQYRKNKWVVSFMMPAAYLLKELPVPKNINVSLRQVPEKSVASIRYSGLWSEKNYQYNLKKLESWIDTQSFKVTGEPIWARYNPPYTLWFMRRNEILIPIKQS